MLLSKLFCIKTFLYQNILVSKYACIKKCLYQKCIKWSFISPWTIYEPNQWKMISKNKTINFDEKIKQKKNVLKINHPNQRFYLDA